MTLHLEGNDWVSAEGPMPELQDIPGAYVKKGRVHFHRSHLPVLGLEQDFGRWVNKQRTLGYDLRPYQQKDKAFVEARHGALIAYQMRMGKTALTLATIDDATSLVVVGPLSTSAVWEEWFLKRWPTREPLLLRGAEMSRDEEIAAKTALLEKRPIFVNYDILPAWQAIATGRIGTLVLDEAHLLANQSQRSKAARNLSVMADRRILLTGTPVWNDVAGLWSLLACACPGAFGSYYDFCRRYASGTSGAWGFKTGAPSNEAELSARLEQVLLRRTWADVGVHDMIDRSVRQTSMSADEMLKTDIALAAAQANAGTKAATIGMMARLRKILCQPKLPLAIRAAWEAYQAGKSAVVWCWHKDVARELQVELTNLGVNTWHWTGDETVRLRNEILKKCREHTPCVLVATLASAGAGVDFSFAEEAIFLELDWTPAVVGQAEMRTFSPTRRMKATYLTANHPFEQKMVSVLMAKVANAERLGLPASDSALDLFQEAANG